MKFFIDTANLSQIKEAEDLGVLDGVTTNPSLMAKEGIVGQENILKHYVDICNIVTGDVSAEVISTDFKGMVAEGEKLAALHKQIVVKVPMIKDGIKAIKYFSSKGIRTNCTLVFSAGQAILAAKAGATYLSPFIGRLDDINQDGVELIRQIVQIYKTYRYKTQVLAASIRSSIHIVKCAEAGADVATCPLSAILDLLKHPLTESGLAKFLADHKKGAGSRHEGNGISFAMLVKIFPTSINMKLVDQVVDSLQNDGVIVIPTDTVYALACSIKNARAFERICRIKNVKPDKAQFSFVCYDLSDISQYTKPFSRDIFRIMKNHLPGPFTFILNASNMVPTVFRSNKKTIGIRVPDNEITRTIIKGLGNPVMTTSIHNEDHLIDYQSDPDMIDELFGSQVDMVIDGGFSELIPSTIIDCTSDEPVVVREGKGKLVE